MIARAMFASSSLLRTMRTPTLNLLRVRAPAPLLGRTFEMRLSQPMIAQQLQHVQTRGIVHLPAVAVGSKMLAALLVKKGVIYLIVRARAPPLYVEGRAHSLRVCVCVHIHGSGGHLD